MYLFGEVIYFPKISLQQFSSILIPSSFATLRLCAKQKNVNYELLTNCTTAAAKVSGSTGLGMCI
ncbi:hypothetical protein NIES3585_28330 [Nodularia sp. NIES-3585]|nr:hypothetical protein NIES3585_28330 [Nodularia sp. NIES-3585]